MSRFVSGGTDEEPTQRDEAWLKAQKQLDEAAIARQEAAKGGGKSLFDTLQANKAAKQEAFEESTKLTNQFRSLDEDEIKFLDAVQERTRAKELAEKKDTKEHLGEFRKQQEEIERAAKEQESAAAPPTVTESWAAGPRKRKKGKEKDGFGGLKIRRTSTGEKATGDKAAGEKTAGEKTRDTEDGSTGQHTTKADEEATANSQAKAVVGDKTEHKTPVSASPTPPTTAAGLGLGAYSSDEED